VNLCKIVFAKDIDVNVSEDILLDHVRQNIKRCLPQAMPYLPNLQPIALVCGGPSLSLTEKELVKLTWSGVKVACVNGSYQWCIERNIKPSVMIMLDARQFNSRFVAEPVPGCRYLLAGQCHPDAFATCEDRDVTIWHACSGQPEFELLKQHYGDEAFFPITLGTTVTLRAISLLRLLGFQSFHIFGLDSCWLKDRHHAYEQKENDKEVVRDVYLVPKDREDLTRGPFICSPWQVKQALDFQQLVRERGDTFQLDVRGPGLIAAIMEIASHLGNEMKILEN